MKWVAGDILKLSEYFEENIFDLIIDKGTMDALVVD